MLEDVVKYVEALREELAMHLSAGRKDRAEQVQKELDRVAGPEVKQTAVAPAAPETREA